MSWPHTHPTAIDAFEADLRRAKNYLDEYAERPDRWVCVRLLRRVLKTGFATLHEIEQRTESSQETP